MLLERLQQLRQRLWGAPSASPLQGLALRLVRAADALACVLWDGQLSLRAMSLVYTTLLSLTPLLALGFSLLKALGVHNMLQPLLLESLRGLGPQQSREVATSVVGFVENIQVGVLGSLGVALLLYAAMSLIQKVESSFNHVWHIERPRSLSRRFGEYLAVLMVGPAVVVTALGLTASLMDSRWLQWIGSLPPLGFVLHTVGQLLPYALMVGLFTFLYAFIPNTPVRAKAAFTGGLLAGVLWQSASFVFAAFVAGASNYNAIYSGFAIVIFVLIWLYLGWLILLIGCQLAYFVQHPERMNPFQPLLAPAGRARESAGLALLLAVVAGFLRGTAPIPRQQLARELGINEPALAALAAALVEAGILAESGSGWLPARDPAGVRLSEAWQALRGPMPVATGPAGHFLRDAETAVSAIGSVSLREWAQVPAAEWPDARSG